MWLKLIRLSQDYFQLNHTLEGQYVFVEYNILYTACIIIMLLYTTWQEHKCNNKHTVIYYYNHMRGHLHYYVLGNWCAISNFKMAPRNTTASDAGWLRTILRIITLCLTYTVSPNLITVDIRVLKSHWPRLVLEVI